MTMIPGNSHPIHCIKKSRSLTHRFVCIFILSSGFFSRQLLCESHDIFYERSCSNEANSLGDSPVLSCQ